MKIAIMQPTYLPWAGYFNLIQETDAFVFLNDVQFSPRSWQQRNRIVLGGQPLILTVPVHTKGKRDQTIREVTTDETQNWRRKHLLTLQRAYAKHPHGSAVVALIEKVLAQNVSLLAEINVALIRSFCEAMGMGPTFHISSQFSLGGHKSDHLLAICRHLGANAYLSPVGSREYIEEEGVFAGSDVQVSYQDYVPPPYAQPGVAEFISHMSIVDVLASLGFEEGRRYIGRADA
jgi:hypothetical protein